MSELFSVKDKVIAITGAGGVLCGEMAKHLAKAGAKVAVLDLNEKAAEKVADNIKAENGVALAVTCNVLERETLEAAKATINSELGKIDILINGAGGNVGPFAVQIAKSFGAEVTGVDAAGKLDMLRSIGADHVIDYTQEDVLLGGQRYDRILDVAAFRSIFAWKQMLRPRGVYVVVPNSMAGMFKAAFLGPLISIAGGRKMGIQMGQPFARDDVAFLTELIEDGRVTPVIDRRYPLDEVPEALRYQETGHPRGKIVITI